MDGITRRHGHNLPHWTAEGATYFVTYRLADSLPKSVVMEMEHEYRKLVQVEEQAVLRKLNADEVRRAKTKLRNRLETYLDAGHGACHLAKPTCAAIVRDSLLHFDGERYELGAWAVMPNHVHVLVRPREDFELNQIV